MFDFQQRDDHQVHDGRNVAPRSLDRLRDVVLLLHHVGRGPRENYLDRRNYSKIPLTLVPHKCLLKDNKYDKVFAHTFLQHP